MRSRKGLYPALSMLLFIAASVSLALGKYPVPLKDMLSFLLLKALDVGGMDPDHHQLLENLLIHIRMPRILAAILIGASLSVSGAAFQAMFVNPLVSPGLLGVLAGASFGAALGMVFFKSWIAVQASTFVFGLPFFTVILKKARRGWM